MYIIIIIVCSGHYKMLEKTTTMLELYKVYVFHELRASV